MPDKLTEARCPLCRKPAAEEFRPFCGKGCRDRDLLGWLNEDYRVAGKSSGDREPGVTDAIDD